MGLQDNIIEGNKVMLLNQCPGVPIHKHKTFVHIRSGATR